MIQKIGSYPLSILFGICFFLSLLVFHPIQWLSFNLFGYSTHKKSVDVLNWFLLRCANILGTTFDVINREIIPENAPIIFVANHQSMYDITTKSWFLRKWHPKYVSKKELGKGIPSVSYNLRHGGSILIDRKDANQALRAIQNLGKYINKHNRSAVIYPEGTRSRNGEPKRFSENGLRTLCAFAPDAYVVPLTINNSWKLFRYGNFPLGLGAKIKLTVHQPLKVSEMNFEELFQRTEKLIKSTIK